MQKKALKNLTQTGFQECVTPEAGNLWLDPVFFKEGPLKSVRFSLVTLMVAPGLVAFAFIALKDASQSWVSTTITLFGGLVGFALIYHVFALSDKRVSRIAFFVLVSIGALFAPSLRTGLLRADLFTSQLVVAYSSSSSTQPLAFPTAGQPTVAPPVQNLRNALDEPMGLSFTETPLEECVELLRDFVGLDIRFDSLCGQQRHRPLTVRIKVVPLKVGLQVLLNEVGLTYERRGDVLFITVLSPLQQYGHFVFILASGCFGGILGSARARNASGYRDEKNSLL